MTELHVAFGVWAAAVGMVGVAIVWELSRLRNDIKSMSVALNKHILNTERRVTHIESHMSIKHDDFKPVSERS